MHHANVTKWMCSKCDSGFKTHSALAHHDYHYHEQGQFECGSEQCGFVGETRIKVQLHQECKHCERDRNYRCQFDGCLIETLSQVIPK